MQVIERVADIVFHDFQSWHMFFKSIRFDFTNEKTCKTKFIASGYKNSKLRFDLINADTNKKVAKEGSKIPLPLAMKFEKEGLKNILIKKFMSFPFFVLRFVGAKTKYQMS